MSLRAPLARVLGYGSTQDGVRHWRAQRLTAYALVPLTVWLLLALIRVPLSDYAAVTAWIASGWNPVLLGLAVLAMSWHSQLGVQVVIEDYVHGATAKGTLLLLSKFGHVLLAAGGSYAVLRVAMRGF